MDKKYKIELNLKELLSIDGKVSKEAQEVINKAKQESSYGFELPVMNEILRSSEENGKLTWTYKSIRSCSYCDKKYDYRKYPRNSRYHNKGDSNYDKPIYYSGLKFNEGFITVKGYGDMCSECEVKYNVIHRLIDYIIENDLKIEIQRNDYKLSKYIRDEIKVCYECENEMQESKMDSLPTLMGNGYYKGKCPYCGAESLPFGKSHNTTNKHIMIENPAFSSQQMLDNFKIKVDEINKNSEEKLKMFREYNSLNNYIIWTDDDRHRKVVKFNMMSKKYTSCTLSNTYGYFEEELVKNEYVGR